MPVESVSTGCCIVGGGPAGMLLGLLLVRAGVDVTVLEKHADFFRDFRGDTIHPSTLEIMYELGLLDDFLKLPHQEVRQLGVQIGNTFIPIGDFTHLPTHCKFLMFMPQWDFLNFIAERARWYPTFRLRMQTEAVGLLTAGDRVTGVRATSPQGDVEISADLIVGTDGRHSTVRDQAGLEVVETGVPIDVLWFRLPRRPDDPGAAFGRLDRGKMMVMIDRGDYFQCGFLIHKDGYDELQRRGIESFREDIAQLAPFMRDRVVGLRDWSEVSLLTVKVDHLRRWYREGLLCIGDAAHAMSPVGGVGINLAIQDAVAAANILARPLLEKRISVDDLQRVQRRREFPARVTQRVQVFIQNNVFRRVLAASGPTSPPWPMRLVQRWPLLRRLPAYAVGVGLRPEHVHTRDVRASEGDRAQARSPHPS
jgi:2-polyprenyl-6-methoxyphenol hydroxylase-like FAD-dependent oxidoreductase